MYFKLVKTVTQELTGNCSYSLLTFLSQTGSPSCFLLRFVPGPLSKYSCAGGSKFSFHYSGFSLFLLNFFGQVVVFSFSLFLLNFSEQVAVLIFSLFLLNFSARQVAGDQHSWPGGGGSRRRGSLSGNYSLGEKQPSQLDPKHFQQHSDSSRHLQSPPIVFDGHVGRLDPLLS